MYVQIPVEIREIVCSYIHTLADAYALLQADGDVRRRIGRPMLRLLRDEFVRDDPILCKKCNGMVCRSSDVVMDNVELPHYGSVSLRRVRDVVQHRHRVYHACGGPLGEICDVDEMYVSSRVVVDYRPLLPKPKKFSTVALCCRPDSSFLKMYQAFTPPQMFLLECCIREEGSSAERTAVMDAFYREAGRKLYDRYRGRLHKMLCALGSDDPSHRTVDAQRYRNVRLRRSRAPLVNFVFSYDDAAPV